jgi:NitT/TauT family transport system substrate-binding protein
MRIAIPDLISNSYFPAIAAAELGLFKEEGLDLTLELISPLGDCIKALKDGYASFVGASAHAPLLAFPDWQGAKLLCAQAQGMYWYLVMRRDLGIARGDLAALKNRRIGAVPFVGQALRELLKAAGIDPAQANIDIAMPQETLKPGVNFGVAVAQALRNGTIDGFFANGMGAEVAVEDRIGDVVLDVRRGDGPKECFNYTLGAIATTDRVIEDRPDAAAAVIRAVRKAQQLLKAGTSNATVAAKRLFPAREASLIASVVERDLPYYDPAISPAVVQSMNAYTRRIGMLAANVAYEQVVALQFQRLWRD